MDLKQFSEATNNLKDIRAEMIRNNPQTIKYIRVLLGLFQSELENLTGIYRKRISEYELGMSKPTNKTIRKILTRALTKQLSMIQNPEKTFQKNLQLLTSLRLSGLGKSTLVTWRKRGIISGFKGSEAAPFTEQEKEIETKLKKKNTKWHVSVSDKENKMIPISVDLMLSPKRAVLMRRVNTQNRRNLQRHAAELALESFRLKKRMPDIKVICIFEAPKITNKVEVLLTEATDWWATSIQEFLNKVR